VLEKTGETSARTIFLCDGMALRSNHKLKVGFGEPSFQGQDIYAPSTTLAT
jgi:hypothetical protein